MALPTPKRVKGLLELMDEALDIDAAYEGVKRLGLKPNNTSKQRAKAMGKTAIAAAFKAAKSQLRKEHNKDAASNK